MRGPHIQCMFLIVLCLVFTVASASPQTQTCPPANFTSQPNFNLDSYISAVWYVQEQMTISYLPESYTYCVTAEYNRKKSLLGYDISVKNLAYNKDGELLGPLNTICAKIKDEANGRFAVSPCFLPIPAAGPYWVLSYSESEGYALVSGGPPKFNGINGGCRTGTGTNDSGLWIFTREENPPAGLVERVRDLAEKKGFDTSVLVSIDNSNCTWLS